MRFFLVAPANMATGGTELLHQFSKCLTDMGVDNYMIYPDADGIHCPTPETFMKYGVKYVTRYVDSDDAVLVLTETQVHLVKECVKGTALIWWLSVDNYLEAYKNRIISDELDIFNLREKVNVMHFVQSYYAKDFVENTMKLGETYFLKDYINDQIVDIACASQNSYGRQNICLYNPKKGFETLQPIIEKTKGKLEWIPLIGLMPDEMAKLMCQAKVYVDFGNHPGKDRIPREAALCGCLLLTNRRGSAAYAQDVSIPEEYKIADTNEHDLIIDKIMDLLENYDAKYEEYEGCRNKILAEKDEFIQEVKQAVELLKTVMLSKSILQVNIDASAEPILSVRNALKTMDKLAMAAVNNCYEGKVEQVRNNLFTMDYILQIVRETIYAELVDLSHIENDSK